MRTRKLIIDDIKKLVKTKGFIYAFCMIAFEDSHVNLVQLHQINVQQRLSTKEIAFLAGFLIQNPIDFSYPDSLEDLISIKKRTYELMEELHRTFMDSFFEKLVKTRDLEIEKKRILGIIKSFFLEMGKFF